MKNLNELRFIAVSGYGWSGSGACIDILREFKGIDGPNNEFRIIKDPYGLLDLESSLIDNWDFVRHDVAIKDFLEYCKVLSRDAGLFKKEGRNFSKILNTDFVGESARYISNILDFKYEGFSIIHRYGFTTYQAFIYKIKCKFKRPIYINMYFSKPSRNKFVTETRKYLINLFRQYAKDNNLDAILLDQAISISSVEQSMKYFDNLKLIIVDRDPRDVYVDMIKGKFLLSYDISKTGNVDKYIKWHKKVRDNIKNDNILYLKFEDLVYNYKDSVERISKFIGSDFTHINQNKYFVPEISVNNIGIWKQYSKQEEINKIKAELCYDYHE
jgi:hypothetical protein